MTDWLQVQKRLQSLGFDPGPLDGLPGPRTDAAIVAFKRSVGLSPRPYFGPLTASALLSRVQGRLPWLQEAQKMMDLHEVRDRTRLMAWFERAIGQLDPREVPWCGAFVATCLRLSDPQVQLPRNPLLARNWLSFGQPCEPVFGSIMVFWRGSRSGTSGHVAFNKGETLTTYRVLGANQRNAVNEADLSKDRFLGARWPLGVPITTGRVRISQNVEPTSHDEA